MAACGLNMDQAMPLSRLSGCQCSATSLPLSSQLLGPWTSQQPMMLRVFSYTPAVDYLASPDSHSLPGRELRRDITCTSRPLLLAILRVPALAPCQLRGMVSRSSCPLQLATSAGSCPHGMWGVIFIGAHFLSRGTLIGTFYVKGHADWHILC